MQENIKRIRADQAGILRELRLSGLKDAPEAFGPRYAEVAARPEEYWEAHAREYATSAVSATFLLIRANRAVGMTGAYLDGGRCDHAYICNMWVAPEFRRGGAGGRMVDTASRWLAEQGAERINAWVLDTNAKALHFYMTLGFVETGQTRESPHAPGHREILLAFDVALL